MFLLHIRFELWIEVKDHKCCRQADRDELENKNNEFVDTHNRVEIRLESARVGQ
jgi:hypothetical protein